jgi:formiminotetrahydrofolate cyclodeaminase
MLLDQTLRDYIDAAASDAPTPGGGSVSALAGALGSCMASMAANFTAGRKKYADVEEEVRAILGRLAEGRAALLQCAEEDEVAFAKVGAAYGMPRETEAETTARREAIQAALREAMDVPLRAMRAAKACLADCPRLAEIGNPNLVSDTGVAAVLAEAALRAAGLNVEVNLASLKDEALVAATRTELDELTRSAAALREEAVGTVRRRFGG